MIDWLDELPDSARREYEKRRRMLEQRTVGEASWDAAPEQKPIHLGLLGPGYWLVWGTDTYRLDSLRYGWLLLDDRSQATPRNSEDIHN